MKKVTGNLHEASPKIQKTEKKEKRTYVLLSMAIC